MTDNYHSSLRSLAGHVERAWGVIDMGVADLFATSMEQMNKGAWVHNPEIAYTYSSSLSGSLACGQFMLYMCTLL